MRGLNKVTLSKLLESYDGGDNVEGKIMLDTLKHLQVEFPRKYGPFSIIHST